MKPAGAWRNELQGLALPQDMLLEEGRGGRPTLRAGAIYLHSRYNPEQEAERLVESAALDAERPVLVVGLGLGYHVAALRARGFEAAVLEPDPAVARLALEAGVLPEDVPLAIGDPAAVAGDEAFQAYARRTPQLLVHPPTAHLHADYAEAATSALAKAALQGRHLNIAVVGPMFGGSLPMLDYLVRAFRKLGHRTLPIDNSNGWALYEAMTGSVKSEHAQGQLGSLLTQVLAEWTYARVAEFEPEICIVLAQAPVSTSFPQRLRKQGILTAFWFVENWRH
ncbi:MAG: hypothetical protein IT368_16270, partial [Candidatus Hydrogenedentes bacterium]|nr:hypothetical protein [Candidatus Hydrogenedentota bacterium]